jgi:hypothetical protein
MKRVSFNISSHMNFSFFGSIKLKRGRVPFTLYPYTKKNSLGSIRFEGQKCSI